MQLAQTSRATRQPDLLGSLRALPSTVWILFLGTFLNKFGTFVVPFLTFYLTRQGYTPGQAGLAVGAYGAGHAAASLTGGWLADAAGRRRTLVLSMFSGAAAMLLLSAARGFPMIVALTFLAGLTGEMYRPACSALLADLIEPRLRLTAYAAYRLSFNAGWAFGPATAGFLATCGFSWLFVGDATSSVLYGILAWVALPKDRARTCADPVRSNAARRILRDGRFCCLLIAAFMVAAIFFQISSTLSLYTTHLGLPASTYGFILSLNGVMVVLCELPLTTITRRFPPRRVIASGYALAGLGVALNAFARSAPALVGCMAVMTLGEMVALPVCSAYVADLAPRDSRGRYLGAYALTWSLGMMVGPALGVRLYAIHTNLPWFCFGSLGLAASAIVLASLSQRSTVAPGNRNN